MSIPNRQENLFDLIKQINANYQENFENLNIHSDIKQYIRELKKEICDKLNLNFEALRRVE